MPVKPHDELRIRKAVRAQIKGALQDDLEGGELIMKEAWEECANLDEKQIAEDELRAIIALVDSRGPSGWT